MDPRDALSRALTSVTPRGGLLGIEHAIPVNVIDEAPGNAGTFYEVECDTFSITVRKASKD